MTVWIGTAERSRASVNKDGVSDVIRLTELTLRNRYLFHHILDQVSGDVAAVVRMGDSSSNIRQTKISEAENRSGGRQQ